MKAKKTKKTELRERGITRATADANDIKDGDVTSTGAVYRVPADDSQPAKPELTTPKKTRKSNDHVREVDGKDVVFRVEVDDHDPSTNGSTDAAASVAPTTNESSDAPAPKKSKKAAKPKVELTIALLAEGYLAALEDSGAGSGTIASYGMELKIAQRELGSETPVALLTDDRVREYFFCDAVMKTRTGKMKAPPTYLKSQRVLRQALVWAQTEKLIERAPIPELAPKLK